IPTVGLRAAFYVIVPAVLLGRAIAGMTVCWRTGRDFPTCNLSANANKMRPVTAILELTDAQAAKLERILQSTEMHHRTVADRALRMRDMKTMRRAQQQEHEAAELLQVLRMTRLGLPMAIAS